MKADLEAEESKQSIMEFIFAKMIPSSRLAACRFGILQFITKIVNQITYTTITIIDVCKHNELFNEEAKRNLLN